jgi:hypothetical protein
LLVFGVSASCVADHISTLSFAAILISSLGHEVAAAALEDADADLALEHHVPSQHRNERRSDAKKQVLSRYLLHVFCNPAKPRRKCVEDSDNERFEIVQWA